MTQFKKTLNKIHRELWSESNNGKLEAEEVQKIIKIVAGRTVVEEYWDELVDFGIIEQVPNTQTWIVTRPEQKDIEIEEQDTKRTQVSIPRDVLEEAEQMGVDISRITTEAIIEEVDDRKEFIERNLNEELSDNEEDYIFELIQKNLESETGSREERSEKSRRRRDIYREVFGEEVGSDELKHIEKLRKKAFKIADMLQL